MLKIPVETYEALSVLNKWKQTRHVKIYTVNSVMRVEQIGMRDICCTQRAAFLLLLTAFLSFQTKQAFVFNDTVVLMPMNEK